MKKTYNGLCVIAFALIMALSTAYAEPSKNSIHWMSYNGDAFVKAEHEHQPVMVFVTSSWCQHCKEMDERTLKHPSVEKYIEKNFVSIRATTDDLPVITRYNITELPTLLVLDDLGNVLEQFSGFRNDKETMKVLVHAYRKSRA